MSTELVMLSNHLILFCPLLLCLQSFLPSGSFPMGWLFAPGGQSIGASASASVASEGPGAKAGYCACPLHRVPPKGWAKHLSHPTGQTPGHTPPIPKKEQTHPTLGIPSTGTCHLFSRPRAAAGAPTKQNLAWISCLASDQFLLTGEGQEPWSITHLWHLEWQHSSRDQGKQPGQVSVVGMAGQEEKWTWVPSCWINSLWSYLASRLFVIWNSAWVFKSLSWLLFSSKVKAFHPITLIDLKGLPQHELCAAMKGRTGSL